MILTKEIQLWKSYVNHIKRSSVDILKVKKIGTEILRKVLHTLTGVAIGGTYICVKLIFLQSHLD
jgi:succinate dehydrogenase/fumarate reductase cytochrome b subunit